MSEKGRRMERLVYDLSHLFVPMDSALQ